MMMIYRPPATVHCIPEKGHAISNGVQFNEPCLVLQEKKWTQSTPMPPAPQEFWGLKGAPISLKKKSSSIYMSGWETWIIMSWPFEIGISVSARLLLYFVFFYLWPFCVTGLTPKWALVSLVGGCLPFSHFMIGFLQQGDHRGCEKISSREVSSAWA